MHIIEIAALGNGAHRQQNGPVLPEIPEGWAVIPEDMEIPSTYPFVDIEVDGQVVTAMHPGVVPEPEPMPEPEPTDRDILNALLGQTEEEVG